MDRFVMAGSCTASGAGGPSDRSLVDCAIRKRPRGNDRLAMISISLGPAASEAHSDSTATGR